MVKRACSISCAGRPLPPPSVSHKSAPSPTLLTEHRRQWQKPCSFGKKGQENCLLVLDKIKRKEWCEHVQICMPLLSSNVQEFRKHVQVYLCRSGISHVYYSVTDQIKVLFISPVNGPLPVKLLSPGLFLCSVGYFSDSAVSSHLMCIDFNVCFY